ncbi:peptidylprolyl isomerase [Frigoriglobus tundricola]|uniref:Peptidyl-prolyl cis-trans isomerase n=1 Tax=Frigoriglobus tundricola TaxID=2774151 RepID=A0A6M5YHS1_9BACT|nr:peptidylprolyl isomerase [Frigoriglobus tundricola]QJW92860.1 Peptidyl-prolyl cis-trans isomerase PpiA precursor [Frigoriglobus tundricola]
MTSVKALILCFVAVGTVAGSARAANPVVELDTSLGTIKIELFEEKAPVTVKNFLKYVEDKHYDGTTFHRVMPTFMIQGGGFEPGKLATNKPKPTRDAIKNESTNGLSNLKGTVAMARTPKPDSATSQFFINVKDNTFLDKAKAEDGVGYCVFGRVISGLDVVEKIKDVETTTVGEHENTPKKDVLIKSVTLVKEEKK